MSDIKGEHIVKRLILGDANLIEGPYVRNEAKADMYAEGVKLLEVLHENMGGFEYEADDVNTPRYIHQIEIRWIETETILPGYGLSEILSKFDNLLFTREKILADTWLLSSEIYKEIKDDSK